MDILFYIVVAIILAVVILNIFRKLHWDVIHHNLLELVDAIGGQVIRKGILARPVYHGRYADGDLTINFSTEKSGTGRKNYIDISLGRSFEDSFTVSSLAWLEDLQEESLREYHSLDVPGTQRYGIRWQKGRKRRLKESESEFLQHLKSLDPFRFIFFSKNGILFEKEGANLGQSTRHPNLKNDIDTLISMTKIFE